MANAPQAFPEIICQDGVWFLRYVGGGEVKQQIKLPDCSMMNKIWQAAAGLLNVYVDDCGGDRYCVEPLREAAKAFAGISELLSDEANQQELDKLYEYDENEPFYQR